jgi:hypothetical protein
MMFAFWAVLVGVTNYEHFYNGYMGKGLIVTEGDRKFAQDCKERDHISDRVPEECEYYISIATATPLGRAWHNVRRHYVGCGLWACGDVLRALSDAVGFSLIVFIFAAGIGVVVALHFLNLVARFMPASVLRPIEEAASPPLPASGRRQQPRLVIANDNVMPLEEGRFIESVPFSYIGGGADQQQQPQHTLWSTSQFTVAGGGGGATRLTNRVAPRTSFLIEK